MRLVVCVVYAWIEKIDVGVSSAVWRSRVRQAEAFAVLYAQHALRDHIDAGVPSCLVLPLCEEEVEDDGRFFDPYLVR